MIRRIEKELEKKIDISKLLTKKWLSIKRINNINWLLYLIIIVNENKKLIKNIGILKMDIIIFYY